MAKMGYSFLVKRRKYGKMDKYILTNNKITGDKPSQQLFPKLVATQLHLLNWIIKMFDKQNC